MLQKTKVPAAGNGQDSPQKNVSTPILTDSRSIFDTVKEAVDVASVIGRYVTLRQQGKYLKGLCPFHKEKTPSFTIDSDRQRFKCYGCGAYGDVFDFIEQIEQLASGTEALRRVSEDAGISVQSGTTPRRPRFSADEELRAQLFAIGFVWLLDEYLGLLTALMLLEEPSKDDVRIYNCTQLLQRIRGFSRQDLVKFFLAYRRIAPRFVGRCIREVAEFQQDLGELFVHQLVAA